MLLDDKGRLALGDFGIARLGLEDQITQTGQVLGTAAYISPEQAMGEPATPASDRYALAVVAFELLTGAKPFTADNFAAQARSHVEDDPPRASERDIDVPEAIWRKTGETDLGIYARVVNAGKISPGDNIEILD